MNKLVMHRSLFIVILFMFMLVPRESVALNCLSQKIMHALSESGEDREEIEKMLKALEEIEVTVVAEKIAAFENEVKLKIKNKPESFVLHYIHARTYYIWGQYYLEIKKDKKQGKISLEESLVSAERAIQLKKDFSDAYRLAGDLYGWLIDLKGAILFGSYYGSKADKLLRKAQYYDSDNPEVYLALGRKYFYTPILFGGSKKKAIASFERAIDLCPDYYLAHMWLGQGYINRGLLENAEKSFKTALMYEPNGSWAKEDLKKIKDQ